jgi:hypothetical protein
MHGPKAKRSSGNTYPVIAEFLEARSQAGDLRTGQVGQQERPKASFAEVQCGEINDAVRWRV